MKDAKYAFDAALFARERLEFRWMLSRRRFWSSGIRAGF